MPFILRCFAMRACALTLLLGASLGACKSTPPETEPASTPTPSIKPDQPIAQDSGDAVFNDAFAKMADRKLIKLRVRKDSVELNDKKVLSFDAPYHIADADRGRGGPQALLIKTLYNDLEAFRTSSDTTDNVVLNRAPARRVVVMLDADAPYRLLAELLFTMLQQNHQPHRVVIRRADGVLDVLKVSMPTPTINAYGLISSQEHSVVATILSEGINLSVGGKRLPPVDGCEASDVTVCLQQGAYDMRRVYALLTAAKATSPEQTIKVELAKTLPVKVLAQFAQTALFVRDGADAQGQFADDASFDKAAPALTYKDSCRDGAQDPGDLPVCLYPYMTLGYVK